MKGKRQGYAARQFAAGTQDEFTIDKRYRLLRLRFLPTDGLADIADTIQMEIEGENWWSGQAVPLALIADPVDDANGAGAVQKGAYVFTFDDPPEWSTKYPIRITINNSPCWVATEAIPDEGPGD